MALLDALEVWLAGAGVSLVCLSGGAALMNKMVPEKLPVITKFYKWFLALGVSLVVSSFLVALSMGRLVAFSKALSSPIMLGSEVLSLGTPTYAQSCVDNQCTKYCCRDKIYPELKWKDCSEACNGWDGHFGELTGDTCLGDMQLDAYCKARPTATNNYRSSACNKDPALGPVTCSCCSARDITGFDTHWWDCQSSCSSNGGSGKPVDYAACPVEGKLYCISKSDDSQYVSDNNSQSF